ncbi:MAG TPA: tetratricopeptide repeat protein [Kofleriaceae bacterium]|nr:tetratricopeptide repeat protein [Kofleriaceae bacterium]
MHRRLHAALSILFTLVALAGISRAQPDDAEITRGIDLYLDLEYEDAVRVLTEALAEPGGDQDRRIEGYQYLALSHLALRNEAEAREAFRKLLEIDRRFRMSTTVSQTARDLLEEVRRSLPPEVVEPVVPASGAAQLSQSASPTQPSVGTPISISIILMDPAGTHKDVQVHHRVRGQQGYSAVTAMRVGQGRYAADVSGMFVAAPAVEYYVVAVDKDGAIVASEGSAAEPLAIPVGSGAAAGAPVYKKWWFWAGVSTAVLAGAVGVLVLTGGDGPGNESTVTITVTE